MVVRCGEVVMCLNFSRVRFHIFGCEDYTMEADFGFAGFTFVAVPRLVSCVVWMPDNLLVIWSIVTWKTF